MIDERIFKAYDIRGIFPRDLDGNTAKIVGYAFGKYMGEGKRKTLKYGSLSEGVLR